MIIDHISRAADYQGTHPGIDAALRFLQEHAGENLEKGRHEIAEGVFALVQEYTTKDPEQGAWEGHRKFIDIQFMLQGREQIGYADCTRLDLGEYEDDRDFVSAEGAGTRLPLQTGDFMVLRPQDMHMPGLALTAPEPVRKIVVKIRV